MNICAVTILGDNEVQHHDSRDLRSPRLVGVGRIRTFQALRDAYAADTSNVGALDDHGTWAGSFTSCYMKGVNRPVATSAAPQTKLKLNQVLRRSARPSLR